MADCRLCELAKGTVRGVRLYEDERLVVLLGLRDGRPVRLLIVPRRHSGSVDGLDDALHTHLLETGHRAAASLGDVGFDLGRVSAELQLTGEHVYLQLAAKTPPANES